MSIYFYGCVTLDGFLADKNHGLDWLNQTGSTEETGYERFYQEMDVTIMGRRTYRAIEGLENAAGIYPTTENYVFTHTGDLLPGFVPVSGSVPEFVRQLGQDKNIWIIGGNTILAPLLERDMVDCLMIQVAPVLLGEGIPLFTQKEGLRRFHLDEVKQYGQFAEIICSKKSVPPWDFPVDKGEKLW